MLAAVLVAWLGPAGPVFSDATARGWYDVLKDWQTLLVALIALAPLLSQRLLCGNPDIGAPQSINSSALISSEFGMVRPNAFAGLRLMTSSRLGTGQLSPMVSSIREHRRNAAGLASGSRANSRQF